MNTVINSLGPAQAQPLVSVIVPSYNQGQYVRETLLSILTQDYRPLEVLVMDGGSNDATLDILRELSGRYPELKWWSEPDSGPAEAVNRGLAKAQGQYACIQSSDDLHYPGSIRAAVAVLQAHPECGLAYGDSDTVSATGARSRPYRFPDFSWDAFLALSCCWPQGSILFSLPLAREIGGWRSQYYSCDLDFWLRLAFRTTPRKVDHVMYGWRRYSGQRTEQARHARLVAGYWRMIDESEELESCARTLATVSLRQPAHNGSTVSRIRLHLAQALAFITGNIAISGSLALRTRGKLTDAGARLLVLQTSNTFAAIMVVAGIG